MSLFPARSSTRSTARAARRALPRLTGACALALSVFGMAGCASKPIDIDDDTIALEPVTASQVASDPGLARGTVLWGGTLVGAANLESGSQLEVLAYPLDRTQRPQVDRPSRGRFIVASADYLETVDFSEGRQVTVLGDLDGLEEVTIGQARRRLPVVQAGQLHLWTGTGPRARPGFSFGIGIGSGGRSSGGVGVGVGF